MAYKDFVDLSVWKKSFDLLISIYEYSKTFPKEERFGLTADIRRSANSVVHNVAVGFGRYEKRDKTRFYKISRASAYEIISQVLVSSALLYIQNKQKELLVKGYKEVINELDMIIKSVETRQFN